MLLSALFPLAFVLVTHVDGHGAMQFPVTRNVHTSHYCPQCANGASVCGSGSGTQWPANDASASMLNSEYTTPLTELVAGGMVEVEVFVTAVHMGHFALELCNNPGSTISEDCFVKLDRDPSDTRFSPYAASAPWAAIFPSNQCASAFSTSSPMKVRFRVPNNLSEHAVLRWYWQTGNSCDSMPEVQSASAPSSVKSWSANIGGRSCSAAIVNGGHLCGSNCPNHSCANEQFKNCADVKIVAGSSSTIVTSSSHNTSSGSGSNESNNNNNENNGNNSGNGSGSNSNEDGSNAGNGDGSNNSGSDNSDSGDVASCKASVGSDNPAWDEDCKNKCEFYAANPVYCGGSDLVSCVKRMASYC